MLASGTVEDLLGQSTSYRLRVPDPATATTLLTSLGCSAHPDGDHTLRVETDRPPGELTRALAAHDVWLEELTPLRPDLETVFLDLTAGEGLATQGALR
jgi:ABC-2 type transport system ATP-binding protein